MADDDRKIQIDDDWKAEAQREKENLAAEADAAAPAGIPAAASLAGLIDLLAMQAVASLGAMMGPGGERMPPNPEAAKHFIDMLQVLETKTKGNMTDDETKMLDTVLYELRVRYVQSTSGGDVMPPGAGPAPA